MKFCQDHWDRLRKALEDRDLEDLIAKDGETVAAMLKAEFDAKEPSAVTFEPLMGAHNAIVAYTLSIVRKASPGSVHYLLQPDDAPEDQVDAERYPDAAGRTWPRCPVCYLGLAHELTCRNERCKLPKVDGYAWMIDRAADDQAEAWAKIQEEGEADE